MFRRIVWTEGSRDHVAKHGVTEREVEAALQAHRQYRRKDGARTTVIARSDGRTLLVVVELAKGATRSTAIVSARDATASERALFQRRKK